MAGWASGQTRIDLRTQGKSVDFSTAASTRPSKTGALEPATCAIGETFLKTDAPAGKKIDMPAQQDIRSFKQAPKAKGKKTQQDALPFGGDSTE